MIRIDWLPQSIGTQIVLLTLAFIFSAVIGLERQRHLKSAGMRTHTLVGVGAAVFTLVSAYGFDTVIGQDVVLDPSRIAAQIVSGIGFLGAGVIFVRQNIVNGLTTAASIWVTAAVGMACGAGMPTIAAAATLLYEVGVDVLPFFSGLIPAVDRDRVFLVRYKDSRGVLRAILVKATSLGYNAALTNTQRVEMPNKSLVIEASLKFKSHKHGPIEDLIEAIHEIKGVISIQVTKEEND